MDETPTDGEKTDQAPHLLQPLRNPGIRDPVDTSPAPQPPGSPPPVQADGLAEMYDGDFFLR